MSVFLAFVMVMCLLPVTAAAAKWEGWNDNEIAGENEIIVDIPEGLEDVLDWKYSDGCVTVTVKKGISSEDWKTLYEYPGEEMEEITVSVGIKVPNGKQGYHRAIGNNTDIVKNYKNTVTGNIGNRRNPFVWGFVTIAYVEIEGETAIVLPETYGTFWLCASFADENEENIEHRILEMKAVLEDGVEGAEIDNPYYVPPAPKVDAERVEFRTDFGETDNTAAVAEKFKKSYDAENGKYLLSYDNKENLSAEGMKTQLDAIDNDNFPYTIGRVRVSAPGEGFVISAFERNGRVMDSGMETYNDDSLFLPPVCYYNGEALYESSDTYKLTWVKGNERYVEEITVSLKLGITGFDTYWVPAETERLAFKDSEYNEVDYDSKGVNISYDGKTGHIETDFDEDPDVSGLEGDGILAYITPPEGAKYYQILSVDCKNDPGYFDGEEIYYNLIDGTDMIEIDIPEEGRPTVPVIGTTHISTAVVNGITVYFVSLTDGHAIVFNWYNENQAPMLGEYVYVTVEDFVAVETTSSFETEEAIGSAVTAPTPIGSDWELVVNKYPQSGRDDAYYFQLESDNAPEGEKTIYIPYAYLDPQLNYEKAREMKLEPKLYHYDEEHNQKELLEGELTKYGMKFVLEDFSPFVIAYELGETTDNNKTPEKESTTVVIDLSGSGKKEEDEANPNTGAPVLG